MTLVTITADRAVVVNGARLEAFTGRIIELTQPITIESEESPHCVMCEDPDNDFDPAHCAHG